VRPRLRPSLLLLLALQLLALLQGQLRRLLPLCGGLKARRLLGF